MVRMCYAGFIKAPLFVLHLSHKSDQSTRSKHVFPIYISFLFDELILINNNIQII